MSPHDPERAARRRVTAGREWQLVWHATWAWWWGWWWPVQPHGWYRLGSDPLFKSYRLGFLELRVFT